jgi:hypothetical protein
MWRSKGKARALQDHKPLFRPDIVNQSRTTTFSSLPPLPKEHGVMNTSHVFWLHFSVSLTEKCGSRRPDCRIEMTTFPTSSSSLFLFLQMSLATSTGPRPNVHFQPWAAPPPPPIFFLFGRGIQSITNAFVFTHWPSVVFSLSTDKAYDGRIKK